MKIEVLFPEICNLYGDLANVRYLKACLPEAEIVETSLKDEPLFARERPDLIYMGTTTERGQLLAIEALRPYREMLEAAIEEGVNFLLTGNAGEIFAREIVEEGEKVADGLCLLDFSARRKARKRYNSLYLGEFIPPEGASAAGEKAAGEKAAGEKAAGASDSEPLKIVGFKTVFGFGYGDLAGQALFTTERGYAMNPDVKYEGIRRGNLFFTYIIGPFLILNPPFTRWFIEHVLGKTGIKLAYEEAAMDAYLTRLKEYSDPNTGFTY